jgi:hypothetical protein
MIGKGTILIVFAWAMEAVGVTGGVVNSTYTTWGDNPPDTLRDIFRRYGRSGGGRTWSRTTRVSHLQ